MSDIKLPPLVNPVRVLNKYTDEYEEFWDDDDVKAYAIAAVELNTPRHTEAEVKADPWLQQALKQAYEYGKADGLKQRHTEAEVVQILSVAVKGQIYEMDEIEDTVRRILGVPAP